MHSWIKDARIAIWGYGREGQAVHQYINDIGGYESLVILTPEPLEGLSGAVNIHGDDVFAAMKNRQFDVLVKSPGISLYDPALIVAQSKDMMVTSATNIWFEANPQARTIVVTGTKGKSTTASMLFHVLKALGQDVVLGGNIGVPLLGLTPGRDLTVIELSSYQLADLKFTPDIFVALNLFPEHVPWHGSVEQYYRDKMSPLFSGGDRAELPLVIAGYENAILRRYADEYRGEIIWFDANDQSTGFKAPDNFTLKGSHNLSNFAAVFTVCQALGYTDDDIFAAVDGFCSLPHRLEEAGIYDGVLYVNDSISTTPQSTLEAVRSYQDRSLILIMGGTDRGQDYVDFGAALTDHRIKHIYVLPGHAERLSAQLGNMVSCSHVRTLEDAMGKTKEIAAEGDVVLLSPAAPSFTQFKNFEERGHLFMQLAKTL